MKGTTTGQANDVPRDGASAAAHLAVKQPLDKPPQAARG